MSWTKDRIRSFGYAFEGIADLFLHTHNARVHAVVAIAVVVAGILFKVSAMQWCALFICIGMVTAAEALNSAIECLADRVTTQRDPMIKKCKDLAAGAVLLVTFAAIATGLIIFIPYVVALF